MMNKRQWIILCLLAAGGAMQAQQWPDAPTEARPGARWWWLGSAVDEKNLTYNLEEYARAGMGTVEITPIYGVQGNDANEIQFLSPRWMEVLRHTQAEGKRTGIEIDMNTGTGWPFGGPEVSIEDAAAKAIFQTYDLEGGGEIEQDIQVTDPEQQPFSVLSRVMAYNGKGECINLTSRVKKDKLQWKAPAGKWKVIALYIGKTRQKVKRAAPGGEGYVMDHLSKKAVKNYLSRFDRAFRNSGTDYPHTFFNDSYEVYQADWTEDFLEQFARRRGYKMEEHFPEFLDETRPETTRRIISDYRETISELLLENFTRQWTGWAHKNGSITRNQAHGSPGNLIDLYASVDIPECEGFGLSQFHIEGLRQDSLTRKNDSDLSMLKYASSAAHIAGKKYTSSETFTWLTEHFRTSLSQCKPDMDLMFVSGINRMFFHGTPYSPKEAEWPGWLFYASINMSPTNSIWRDAPSFFDYITRCQSFLQMGQPDNDFLIYLPVYDMWYEQPGRLLLFTIHHMDKLAPKFIDAVHRISNSGYDGDYISDNFIRSTRFKDGRLVTSGGTGYKALVVPAARLMPDDVLAHLLELARQGATIVFLENYPADVPGYGQLEQRRRNYRRILRQLPAVSFSETAVTPVGKGKIITGTDYACTLAGCRISPEEMKTKFGLQAVRRVNDTGHHYFISSLQNKGVDGWVTLGTNAAAAALFNPMTGECGEAKVRRLEGKTQVYLQLESGESIILRTYHHPLQTAKPWKYIREQVFSLCPEHGWKLHFAASQPEIKDTFDIDSPCSWTRIDHPAAKTNMGTGVYTLDIELPPLQADDWILDLGDVRESARVRINGQKAGCVWAAPYRLKAGTFLQPGKNRIEIEVTNLPANRIAELDRQGTQWRKFKEINIVDLNYRPANYAHWAPMPSGLNGKVRLIPVNYMDD
ncbi:glycosyl hydrolase [uncultured Bacteroides sp.]|uniref:alpha-L-rhamnosidase n=1 Tax=uncultured Bacteroides sp. TaxID=162156 RepID=UPI0026773C25|nr:glycosyl hydrolase [uncultured Bacteroides sp.]